MQWPLLTVCTGRLLMVPHRTHAWLTWLLGGWRLPVADMMRLRMSRSPSMGAAHRSRPNSASEASSAASPGPCCSALGFGELVGSGNGRGRRAVTDTEFECRGYSSIEEMAGDDKGLLGTRRSAWLIVAKVRARIWQVLRAMLCGATDLQSMPPGRRCLGVRCL